jgi:O-antigen/teichoic acid export membrane protein
MTILSALMLFLLTPDRPMPRFSAARVGELLGYGIPSMCGAMLSSGTHKVFTLLAGYFLGTTALGYLNLAFQLVDTLRGALAAALAQLALPLLSRRQGDAKSFASAFRKATEFTATIAMPIFMGLLICAPEAVTLVFGETWAPSIPLVQILSGLSLVHFTRLFAGSAIAALGKPHLNLLVGLMGSTATLGVMVVLAPDSAVTVALIWGLQLLVPLPLAVWLVHRFANVPLRDQAAAPSQALAATALMGAVLVGLRYALADSIDGLMMLAVLVPVGVATYLATVWILNPVTVSDMLDFLTTGLKRKRTG